MNKKWKMKWKLQSCVDSFQGPFEGAENSDKGQTSKAHKAPKTSNLTAPPDTVLLEPWFWDPTAHKAALLVQEAASDVRFDPRLPVLSAMRRGGQ